MHHGEYADIIPCSAARDHGRRDWTMRAPSPIVTDITIILTTMSFERGNHAAEAARNAAHDDRKAAVARALQNPELARLLEARNAAQLNRDLIAQARYAMKGDAAGDETIALHTASTEGFERLIALGETPEQIEAAAARNLAAAEQAVAAEENALEGSIALQKLRDAEAALATDPLAPLQADVSRRPSGDEPSAARPIDASRKAGKFDNRDLPPEVRKALGLDDQK